MQALIARGRYVAASRILHHMVSPILNILWTAIQGFVYQLKVHLLRRLAGDDQFVDGHEPTPAELASVRIYEDKLYIHKTMRINYTTYDARRDQDSINPDNHADVMMLAPEGSEHPYLYARVVGIYHVKAYLMDTNHTQTRPQLLHVVWVRWYDLDTSVRSGFEARRLPRLKWAHVDDGAFSFVSPDDILRGSYIIPRFRQAGEGRSDTALPGRSAVRRARDGGMEDDWDHHYVNM